MRLTEQQTEAVETIASGRHTLITAVAGSGKTSTLREASKELWDRYNVRSRYTSFTKASVTDAQNSFPDCVEASTLHSLAFRHTGRLYKHRLSASRRLTGQEIAKSLGAKRVEVGTGWEPQTLASMAVATTRAWCRTSDHTISADHVPLLPVFKDDPDYRPLVTEVLNLAGRVWDDATNPQGSLSYYHEYYLKQAVLAGLDVQEPIVMFDEGQDLSGVMIAFLANVLKAGSKVVLVGDPNQQIYEWAGAINALDRAQGVMPADTARTELTTSFRFGDDIARLANQILDTLPGDHPTVEGGGPDGAVGPFPTAKAVLCRTNAGAIREGFTARNHGTYHLVGGFDDVLRFAYAAEKLKAGQRTDHPDLAWAKSWFEVRAYAKQDLLGADLELLVDLVDEFSAAALQSLLQGQTAENTARTVVSTAHKSKGREWSTVRLSADFGKFDETMGEEETRLLYVAATRARVGLDVSATPLVELVDGSARQVARAGLAACRAALDEV